LARYPRFGTAGVVDPGSRATELCRNRVDRGRTSRILRQRSRDDLRVLC